jgi:hypothetical protein
VAFSIPTRMFNISELGYTRNLSCITLRKDLMCGYAFVEDNTE